jgi:NAD(P)-dependent dehydrogenase (short-subunit alcohol dehydrogenase family)
MPNYLVIGGTSTIGSSVIKKLLAANHQVFMTGRDPEKTASIANTFSIPFATLDASDFAAVDSVFEAATSALGELHGVVNCAGSLLLKSAHLTRQTEYEAIIAANLTTAFAVVRSAGKYMTKQGGSVVLVSSAAALTGIANHEAIAAAKAGIIGLTYSAAATYAASHLRINAVAPGLTETNLTLPLTKVEAARNASIAMHALGRLGQPDEVAAAIYFFLQPENNWITGQVLAVDGGLSVVRPKIKM